MELKLRLLKYFGWVGVSGKIYSRIRRTSAKIEVEAELGNMHINMIGFHPTYFM